MRLTKWIAFYRCLALLPLVAVAMPGRMAMSDHPSDKTAATAMEPPTGTVSRTTRTAVVPYANQAFALDPKESTGRVHLLFRPSTARADMTIAAQGNWQQVAIDIPQP